MDLQFNIKDPDTEDRMGEKKGFSITTIEAIHNGEVVGYLKISWLLSDNFKKQIPTVWHFEKKWNGKTKIDLDAAESGDVEKLFSSLCGYGVPFPNYEAIESLSLSEKKEFLIRLERERTGHMNEYIKDLIDSPFVDFIKVSDECRRNGIGTSLYIQAARFCESKGYKFRSSRTQSKEAEKTWLSMVKKGRAERTAFGYFVVKS